MTLKVIAGIHWEAVRLLFKGAHFHRRPAPPEEAVTRVPAQNAPRSVLAAE